MKLSRFLLISVALGSSPLQATANEFSGYIGGEIWAFKRSPLFSEQPDIHISAFSELEWFSASNGGDDTFIFKPYLRLDNQDPNRNLVDIREMSWNHRATDWEFNIGINKVFWGQTESQHRVDIINQTDMLASVDGEEKLGQPMVQLSSFQDWGTLEFYWLPWFRPQEYASDQGRFRTDLQVLETESYESSDEDQAMDWALRWSQVYGDLELGLSYFHGTSRAPRLDTVMTDNKPVYQPHYLRMEQLGVDALYLWGEWVWKLEAIYRDNSDGAYAAMTGGFEYTQTEIFDSAMDLGWVVEYSKNSNAELSGDAAQNDIFIGQRLTFNDAEDTEILYGINQDLDDASSSTIVVEGSSRLTGNLRATVNVYLYQSNDSEDANYDFRRDDFAQFTLQYYF